MLRTVFIGSRNEFDELLVHWLARHSELVGVVWTQATAWQRTWRGRLQFARWRLRRYGLMKVLDETGFYIVFHRKLKQRDTELLRQTVIEPYRRRHGDIVWRGDSIMTTDVNDAQTVEFVEARQPDVAFAMCLKEYFEERIRAVPKHGVFLWHEGITPEYRGLYSPFWAVHNLDFERLGYSLLRMNNRLDAGEVFSQGPVTDVDPHRHNHLYIGHKAIWDSLPDVERFLKELEGGSIRPIVRSGEGRSYTYPGLSDLLRQRMRLRRLRGGK